MRFDTQEAYELMHMEEGKWVSAGPVGEKELRTKPEYWIAATEVALFVDKERPADALVRSARAERDRNTRSHRRDQHEEAGSGRVDSDAEGEAVPVEVTEVCAAALATRASAADETEAEARQAARAGLAVGTRVSVYWTEEEQWYGGRVSAYRAGSDLAEIAYDDGATATHHLDAEKWEREGGATEISATGERGDDGEGDETAKATTKKKKKRKRHKKKLGRREREKAKQSESEIEEV